MRRPLWHCFCQALSVGCSRGEEEFSGHLLSHFAEHSSHSAGFPQITPYSSTRLEFLAPNAIFTHKLPIWGGGLGGEDICAHVRI